MVDITTVVIGIPSARGWVPLFGAVAMSMVAHTIAQGNISVYPAIVQGAYLSEGRNHLVRLALEAKSQYILFLDDDMSFHHDALVRLLKHDKDIVGAVYNMRAPPHRTAGFPLDPKAEFPKGGLMKMSHIPTGLCLIKMSVFTKMNAPWFRYQWRPEEANEANPDGMVGEDVLFCRRARKLGFDIWADFDVSYGISHHTDQVIRLKRPE